MNYELTASRSSKSPNADILTHTNCEGISDFGESVIQP